VTFDADVRRGLKLERTSRTRVKRGAESRASCSNARRARVGRRAAEKKVEKRDKLALMGDGRWGEPEIGAIVKCATVRRGRRRFQGPVFRLFSPPPFDQRSRPSRDDSKPSPRGHFARSSNDVRHRCCATENVRRATGREASSRGAVNHGECERRGHPETGPCFIESGPFACRVDWVRRCPTWLVTGRYLITVRRHLNANKGRRAPFRSGPSRGSQRPDSTRCRPCAHRQSPVAQQRCRTSFEDVAKRPRGESFVSSRVGLERCRRGGGGKSRKTGP